MKKVKCLDPCCNGIPLNHRRIVNIFWYVFVLILVVMEYL